MNRTPLLEIEGRLEEVAQRRRQAIDRLFWRVLEERQGPGAPKPRTAKGGPKLRDAFNFIRSGKTSGEACDGRDTALGKGRPAAPTRTGNRDLLECTTGRVAAERLRAEALEGLTLSGCPSALTPVSNLAVLLRKQGKLEGAERHSRLSL